MVKTFSVFPFETNKPNRLAKITLEQ